MRHRELKVGMYITGKPNNGYAVTSQYSICKVFKINGVDDEILVEVIRSNKDRDVGTRWQVNYRRFVKADIDLPDNADIDLPDNKALTLFPVGSYIIGNYKNHYEMTCRDIVCKVIDYKYEYYDKRIGFDSEYMMVMIVKTNGTLGKNMFTVRPSWFEACDYKPYDGLFSKAYYRKLFTISDELIKVDGVKKDSPCYNQLMKECVANGLMKKG